LREFAAIKDPRDTKRIKHSMTVIMVFGLFTFLFRLSSRRQMNKKLTAPAITATLRQFFRELDTIPHADTVARGLGALD
ncbi:MAG: transposase family protein, partial [Gammaproteobacteria bacterium]|nr:transposase family protein [Gammaproteobacteria bacterium]